MNTQLIKGDVGISKSKVKYSRTPPSTSGSGLKPKLLDQVRQAIRSRHSSPRTEQSYVGWIKRYIFFHGKRHPVEMEEGEIGAFLTFLAVEGHVSASTQTQALSAILLLYQAVLKKPLDWVKVEVRGKMPRRLPVVLTKEEVRAVLGAPRDVPADWPLVIWLGAPAHGMLGTSSQGRGEE